MQLHPETFGNALKSSNRWVCIALLQATDIGLSDAGFGRQILLGKTALFPGRGDNLSKGAWNSILTRIIGHRLNLLKAARINDDGNATGSEYRWKKIAKSNYYFYSTISLL